MYTTLPNFLIKSIHFSNKGLLRFSVGFMEFRSVWWMAVFLPRGSDVTPSMASRLVAGLLLRYLGWGIVLLPTYYVFSSTFSHPVWPLLGPLGTRDTQPSHGRPVMTFPLENLHKVNSFLGFCKGAPCTTGKKASHHFITGSHHPSFLGWVGQTD